MEKTTCLLVCEMLWLCVCVFLFFFDFLKGTLGGFWMLIVGLLHALTFDLRRNYLILVKVRKIGFRLSFFEFKPLCEVIVGESEFL